MVVVHFEFCLRCRARVINVVDLFVQAITHDECICERQSMGLHRMSFLDKDVRDKLKARPVRFAHPIVVFADAFWKKVGDYRTRMGLFFHLKDGHVILTRIDLRSRIR